MTSDGRRSDKRNSEHDPHDDGVVASWPLRVIAFLLCGCMVALLVLPPHHWRGFLYGPIAAGGFYFLGRGRRLPNTWLFWLFASVLSIDLAGIDFPIPNNRLPNAIGERFPCCWADAAPESAL